jgi:ribonuclease P protein component
MNFPKTARVRKRHEYLRFFNKSDVKRLDTCLLFRIPNEKGQARVGITVKSRTNSVHRNKIKRQIREAFRAHREKLGAHDYNIVIPGHIKINYLTPQKVRKNLDSLWTKDGTKPQTHETLF